MSNYFDQFDKKDSKKPADQPSAAPSSGNYFDQFDKPVAKEESLGTKAGKFIKDQVQGVPETVATLATGLGSTIVGDSLGVALGGANKLRGALGLEPTRMRVPGTDRTTTEGVELARGIKEAGTYQPRSESGKAIGKALEVVTTPITWTARQAGDVVKEVTGNELAGDVASDVANVIIGTKVIKAAPKIAKATVEGAKTAGSLAKEAGKIYTPEVQGNVAIGHLMAGDIGGAALQGAMATGRKMYANVQAKKAPASVAEAITPDSAVPGILTKEQAAALRENTARKRAAAKAAYEKRTGSRVKSTLDDE